MDDVKKDLILREIYYSPKTGFRSAKHIYEVAKEEGETSISLKDVETWLKTQETYTKYKTFSFPSFFRHTMVRYLGEQMQIDLIFLEKHNDRGYHIILNGIEILSRFAFSKPLKTKRGKEISENLKIILEEFKERFHHYPKLLQADDGSEFKNKDVEDLLKKEDIFLFSTNTARKASVVERFNRTLKDKMRKLHDSRKDHQWVDVLPDLIENYNNQEHSSIGMKPSEVNSSNQHKVWIKLYGHIMNHVGKPKFNIGDKVRVLHFNPGRNFKSYYRKKHPELFEKDGKFKLRPGRMGVVKDIPPFSEEVFTIDKILYGDPIVYKLYSEEAEIEILGIFYENELSLQK